MTLCAEIMDSTSGIYVIYVKSPIFITEDKHDFYGKRQTEKNETFAICLQLPVQ